ncbi:hypothetical protein EGW08_012498 [Elysia chlorotica]|uniref:Uncharacterized protein n=1 Tax=Elysia chlorotica TaxID=188477 RepID=A0A3S1BBP3_ELYCH|nr:hypothetical protein EGW08_012498 [Elysia chlorotica]
MDGSDRDCASDIRNSAMSITPSEFSNAGNSDPPRLVDADQATPGEAESDTDLHVEQPEQEYMDGELEEPDGQRSSVSLDEDGGTHFEASQSQDTNIRRGFQPASLPETGRCESPLGLDIQGDNDIMFDPVQRLNFNDDGDEDEDVRDDNEEGEYYPDAAQSFDPAESEMHQRPVVNGSEQGESARSSGFRSLNDHGQNVRIIEGHDSSFLDDEPQQVQQPTSYGFNFLHTQMIQLPSFSGLSNHGDYSQGFPSNHNRLSLEEDQTHNMYDSLEREDGSSLLGDGIHNRGGEEEADVLQQYFSSGIGGSMSLQMVSGVGHQHQQHNLHHQHNHQGDNEAFWDHDDSSDHGSYLSNSHPHPMVSDSASSPRHARHQSPPRNFQVELCAAHSIPPSDSVFLPSGRQGDGFNSPLERDSGSVGEDSPQNFEEDNNDALNAELSEEGLLQDTQMYAQPVTSAPNHLGNSATLQRNSAGNSFLQTYDSDQCSAPGLSLPQTANIKARQQLDIPNSQQTPPKNLAWSHAQHQSVVELSTESGGVFNVPTQADRRQAGAGRSVSCKDLSQAVAPNFSAGGAIPKKPQTQEARAQQKRRPAVQGSASSSDSQKVMGAGLRATSQPMGRKADTLGAAGDDRARQKQAVGQREEGRGTLPGSSNSTSLHQGRQLQGKMAAGSPLASRANSHTSLASSAGSTNSRVSGVGKESHLVRSQQKVHQAGQMPAPSIQEGKQGSVNMANKSNGGPALTSQSISTVTLPRQVSSQHRPSPANQQDNSGTRNTVLTKQQAREGEREEHGQHQIMPPQAANPNSLRGFSQQGRNYGRPQQSMAKNPSNRGAQSANTAGGQSASRQHPRSSHGSCQGQDQGVRQQSLQRNTARLPVQASSVSPRGSNGALISGASPSGSEGSHHSGGQESVMSQMEALRKQGHRLSPAELNQSLRGNDVQGMEDVRHHLQNILSLGGGSYIGTDQLETASDLLLSEQPVNRELNFDTDSSSFMGPSGPGDMSEILENFPTFSSKMFATASVPPSGSAWLDTSAHSSISNHQAQQSRTQQLREALEKEMYRRKHCEEHIQKLNTKLLEVQQQLAVAVSTDKRKDIMIEQLDKQLARVVEGWKKREAEKDEFLKTLSQEKVQIEESLQSQQGMINNFEVELAQTVDELKKEKEKSAQTIRRLKEDIYEAERAKESATEQLESERDKNQAVLEEWEALKESKAGLESLAQQAQEKLEQEKERWSLKEQEMNNKIAEVKDATQKVVNIEKVKTEELKKKKESSELECAELKAEMKKVVLDMEQLLREKESQKVEMSIMEAKFESAQRKLEADLHSQMEKEIADQAADFHARLDSTVEEMSERHRRQVSELHQRQQRDMAKQAADINAQRDKRDDEFRHQLAELEEKLQDMRTENSALRQSKLKLESQRMEILTKLQMMMQSQWNEAVSLLVNTPQKKSLNSSFLSSSQSGSQLASALAVVDGSASVTSLNVLSASVNGAGAGAGMGVSAARSGGGDGHLASLERQGKRSGTPTSQPSQVAASWDGERARGENRVSRQVEEDAHAQLDRMGRVEDYLERLNQHMEIPMTRNDLHQSPLEDKNVSLSSVTTNTTVASVNSINMSAHQRQQQQQQQHSLRWPESYPHPAGANYNGEQRQSQDQSKLVEGSSQVHGFTTGPAGERIITGGPTDDVSTQPTVRRPVPDQWPQAVPMGSPQQSSSWTHSDAVSEFQVQSLSAYQEGDEGMGNHSYNRTSQQQQQQQQIQLRHPVHNHSHQHQPWNSHHGADGNISSVPNIQHHSHQYPATVSSSASSSSPRAQNQPLRHHQQHQDQVTSPRPQQQTHPYSKSPKERERRTASNINIYTPGSPTFMSSPERYNNSSDQWSPPSLAVGVRSHQTDLTAAAVAGGTQGKRPGPRHFSYIRQTGQLNESLSPPVKQTAERDQTDSASEDSSSYHDPTRLQANYSQLSEKLEEHQSRQGELQHYIRMLLSKAPGSVCSEPERDAVLEPSILESSRDLTVDLDLNDTATALEVTAQLSRLQELREKEQALQGQRDDSAHAQSLPVQAGRPEADPAGTQLSNLFGGSRVISAQGLAEISQLLMMYREQWETNPEAAYQGNVADQLVDALREMTAGVSPEQTRVKTDAKKSSETKVSPRSQRTRKTKKMLNGSQSSGDLTSTTNLDISSQQDRSLTGRGGSGASAGPGGALGARRKVAGGNKPAATVPVAASSSQHHHHNHHGNHSGDGSGKDRKSGPVVNLQSKAAVGGSKTGAGGNGPVWK